MVSDREKKVTDKEVIDAAKNNSAGSVLKFIEEGKKDLVKFTSYHHPGWVAAIDDDIFWGSTPMTEDNWNVPQVCHHANKHNRRARHWLKEFKLLWERVKIRLTKYP